jgi:hypothetical protein
MQVGCEGGDHSEPRVELRKLSPILSVEKHGKEKALK